MVCVKGLVGKVPEVVARKGGMAAPRTCTKYLGERENLLIQKRRSDPSGLTSSRGGNRLRTARKLVSPGDRLPEPEGDGILGYLLGVWTCGKEEPLTRGTMWSG